MTGGELGEAPDTYWLLKAARYLGVAPWDLAGQPAIWTDLALATERAEQAAALWRGPTDGDDTG